MRAEGERVERCDICGKLLADCEGGSWPPESSSQLPDPTAPQPPLARDPEES